MDLHEKRIIHDGVKVIRVAEHEKQEEEGKAALGMDAGDIEVWESCVVCQGLSCSDEDGRWSTYFRIFFLDCYSELFAPSFYLFIFIH